MTTKIYPKHTPGQWHINPQSGKSDVFPEVYIDSGMQVQIITVHDRPDPTEQLANARLVAAAPNMYKHLESLLDLDELQTDKMLQELDYLMEDVAATLAKIDISNAGSACISYP